MMPNIVPTEVMFDVGEEVMALDYSLLYPLYIENPSFCYQGVPQELTSSCYRKAIITEIFNNLHYEKYPIKFATLKFIDSGK